MRNLRMSLSREVTAAMIVCGQAEMIICVTLSKMTAGSRVLFNLDQHCRNCVRGMNACCRNTVPHTPQYVLLPKAEIRA